MNNFIKSNSVALVALVIAAIALFLPVSKTVSPAPALLGAVNSQNTTNFTTVGARNLTIGEGCQNGYGSVTCIGNGAVSAGDFSLNQIIATSTRQNFVLATTTPCSIMSPAATSSLIFWDANITLGTSTAATYVLATSTTAFATTSLISNAFGIGANVGGSLTWDPGVNNSVVSPSTWVVMSVNSPATGQSGTCQAVFTLL